MWSGGYVGTIVPPPATSLLNAPQYATGKALDRRGGRLHQRSSRRKGERRPAHAGSDRVSGAAIRGDARRPQGLPGVTIVADITPDPVNKEGGFATMSTILQAHPDVDVVLGADTVVLGALAALRGGRQGAARPVPRRHRRRTGSGRRDQEAGRPLQGQHQPRLRPSSATPWGSTPPTGSRARAFRKRWTSFPSALTGDNLAQYEADLADPAAVYDDPARRDVYLKMYGNICYDTRDQYVNFPWSSEAK